MFSPYEFTKTIALTWLAAGLAFAAPTGKDSLRIPDASVPVRSLEELTDTAQIVADHPSETPSPSAPDSLGAPARGETPPGDSTPAAAASLTAALSASQEKGMILSTESGKPVPKALVILIGEPERYSTQSDADGLYQFPAVKPGSYRLKVVKRGYAVYENESQAFLAGGNPVREIHLERSVPKGQLIEAKSGVGGSSAASMMAARKSSSGLMEGVGAEQIAKSTDADAGAVAKRVTGASVIGGKFVYVRGLGERYTNMTLNGLPVPSPEKDKRVVPQDLFPSSVIESFSIYKTLAPDLAPDFAGGHIALVTKGLPDKDEFKVDLGLGAMEYLGDGEFLDQSKGRLSYSGGGGWQSYLGFDDGTRSIPAGVPDNVNQVDYSDTVRAGFARRFNNTFGIDTTGMYPAPSLALTYNKVFDLGEDRKAGYTLYGSLKHQFEESEQEKIKTSSELLKVPIIRVINGKEFKSFASVWDTAADGTPVPLYRVTPGISNDITQGKHKSTLTGLANWGYRDTDNLLWAKAFFVNLSEDKVFHNYVTKIPGGSIALQSRDIEEHNSLEYQRRHLLVGQVGGGHYLGRSVLDSLSWAAGMAWTQTEIPDSRKYYYSRDEVELAISRDTVIGGVAYDSGSTAKVPGKELFYEVRSPWGTRTWEDLDEKGLAARLDLKLVIPPEISARTLFRENGALIARIALPQATAGLAATFRNRGYDRTTYDWTGIAPVSDSLGDQDLVERAHDPEVVYQRLLDKGQGFSTSTKNYEAYGSTEGLTSGYFSLTQAFDLLRIPTEFTAGARWEWYYLDFLAPYTGPEVIADPSLGSERQITIRRNDFLWYPSAGLTFEFFRNTKTRLLYSRTVVRPEMRERAPIFFYDTEEEIEVIGNQDLKDTHIQNLDFRFELFLPYSQVISFSAFRKDFTNPVEYYIDAVQVPNRKQYQNAKSAYVDGIEVEANAWLGPLLRRLPGPDPFWNGFNLYGNAAWMRSEVVLDRNAKGAVLVSSFDRPLIGQSPYLYNFKLSHEVESGRTSMLNAVIFNVFGPRIRDLGANGVPDVYEQPFPSLDYLAKLKLGRHSLSFKATNLLNVAERYTVEEFNQSKNYRTISDAQRNEYYADLPDTYTIERKKPGIGLSLTYGLSL